MDPRHGGGRVNDVMPDGLVELVTIGGQERLFYHALPIHVALLRGSTADERGNITMEREALILDNLAQAMAARNSGGVVIVQVETMVAAGSLASRDVVAPGIVPERDILALMGFVPRTDDVSEMDPRIFREGRMGMGEELLELTLEQRIHHDPERGLLFVDLSRMSIQRRKLGRALEPRRRQTIFDSERSATDALRHSGNDPGKD